MEYILFYTILFFKLYFSKSAGADQRNLESILCYNRGCYQKYNPKNTSEDSCQYHPEAPVFSDGKQSWTCCNKKFNNFTEFLKTPGCAKGPHSILRLEEPEPFTSQIIGDDEVNNAELNNPQVSAENNVAKSKNQISENRARLEKRYYYWSEIPNFDKTTKLFRLEPTKFGKNNPALAQKHRYIYDSALVESTQNLIHSLSTIAEIEEIFIGESCKNNDCEATYKGLKSDLGLNSQSICLGGNSLIQQLDGSHKWKKDKCRYDWHQWQNSIGHYVTIVIYGKKYDPDSSYVELNPVRLKCHLVFSEQTVG